MHATAPWEDLAMAFTQWRRVRTASVGLMIGAACTGIAQAQSAKAVVGQLTCVGEGSVGMIISSKETLKCRFVPADGGPSQRYSATITKYGLDLGVTGSKTLIWTVLGSTSALPDGALYGTYAGVSADASIGVGAGANALVGGSDQSVVLQPLSVQGQTGINIAVGVSELTLR